MLTPIVVPSKPALREWPFLNSRERVNRGLLLPVERIPFCRLPTGTSDSATPVGRPFHAGWHRSACSCSANPRLAIFVRLLPADDFWSRGFGWRGRVVVGRNLALRIEPEFSRCCFHPRSPFTCRNLRTGANSGQVVEGVCHEAGLLINGGARLDVKV